MNLKHVALVCSSEEKADRFFADVLGCRKNEPRILPRTLSQALFKVDADLKIVKYQGESTVWELFIHKAGASPKVRIEHVCIEVSDPHAVLTKCRDHGLEIRQVPKGEKIITLIADYDGNLFELT